MFEDFSSSEKYALVCALINVTHADEKLDDAEVEYFQSMMEEKGLEDFEDLLARYEEENLSHDDYLSALRTIHSDEARKTIVVECVGAMDVDDEHHDAEISAIEEICDVWGLDANEFLS